ncbi:hypothetical protein LMQ01_13915, partial [Staphylococcus aureus]|uniref:hypothetical protein n=1 Tax=Staphylococcus aureus TaxID=1280 RepID=UPI001E331936
DAAKGEQTDGEGTATSNLRLPPMSKEFPDEVTITIPVLPQFSSFFQNDGSNGGFSHQMPDYLKGQTNYPFDPEKTQYCTRTFTKSE